MESEVPEKRPGSDSGQVLQMLEEGAPLFRYPEPILLLNRETKIVGANPAALSLWFMGSCQAAPSRSSRLSPKLSLVVTSPRAGKLWKRRAVGQPKLPLFQSMWGICASPGRDISLDQNLRNALVRSRALQISSDFAWETDVNGKFVFVSTSGALGYEPDDLIGRAADDLSAKSMAFRWSPHLLPRSLQPELSSVSDGQTEASPNWRLQPPRCRPEMVTGLARAECAGM